MTDSPVGLPTVPNFSGQSRIRMLYGQKNRRFLRTDVTSGILEYCYACVIGFVTRGRLIVLRSNGSVRDRLNSPLPQTVVLGILETLFDETNSIWTAQNDPILDTRRLVSLRSAWSDSGYVG